MGRTNTDDPFTNILTVFLFIFAIGLLFQTYSHFTSGFNYAAKITRELYPIPNIPVPRPSAIYDLLLPFITVIASLALICGAIFLKRSFSHPLLYIALSVLVFIGLIKILYLAGLYNIMGQGILEMFTKINDEASGQMRQLTLERLSQLRAQEVLMNVGSIIVAISLVVATYFHNRKRRAGYVSA
jgi:glucan phosphoethanolaminetransferase (alkaline phosphatase superfamily)